MTNVRTIDGEGRTRVGGWIQTASGQPFWPLDPRPDEIHVYDVAHALSNLCRFGGHCKTFYSVAEHSVLVSRCVPLVDSLWALLHDATEAYVVDVPRPLKRDLPEYQLAEERVARCVAERFELPWPTPPSVVAADVAVLQAERRALMTTCALSWELDVEPADVVVRGLGPVDARWKFRDRFDELLGLRALR